MILCEYGQTQNKIPQMPGASNCLFTLSMRNMLILNYFNRRKPEERGIFLQTSVSTECIFEEEVAACNKEVEAVVEQQ